MKFFIDTANIDEIREANAMGVLDGVTTNPSLRARRGIDSHRPEMDKKTQDPGLAW